MKLIANVCNPGEYDGFSYAFIDISPALARTILARRDAFKRLEADNPHCLASIEFYDCCPVFVSQVPDGTNTDDLDDLNHDFSETDLWTEDFENYAERTEYDRMVIMGDSVYWCAIPKHCDGGAEVETRPIDYATIEAAAATPATI